MWAVALTPKKRGFMRMENGHVSTGADPRGGGGPTGPAPLFFFCFVNKRKKKVSGSNTKNKLCILLEIKKKKALMRMENGHLSQRKMGTCPRKRVRVKIKGALIRGRKGKGVLLIIRGSC